MEVLCEEFVWVESFGVCVYGGVVVDCEDVYEEFCLCRDFVFINFDGFGCFVWIV